MLDLNPFIRTIPDFPQPGILFRDITPLLAAPNALEAAILSLITPFQNQKIDLVVSPEARGFIFGSAVAHQLHAGFVPVRKENKLPYKTIRADYELEYGTSALLMHEDAIGAGQSVLVVDDVLATGGTAKACCELIEEKKGKVVGCSFLIELDALKGREKLKPYSVHASLNF